MGFTETADTCIGNGVAKTNLGSENLDRWPAGTSTPEVARRACLVNTLLHESMHAIPGERTCGERFIDRGHQHSKVKLVPYTVGSIAECAYLEKFGVIQLSVLVVCRRDGDQQLPREEAILGPTSGRLPVAVRTTSAPCRAPPGRDVTHPLVASRTIGCSCFHPAP